jgi:transposase
MPVAAVGELVGEQHETRIWRIVHHYVDRALAREDLSTVTDETSFRRGQDYVSVFACLDQARVVFATPGRNAGAYARVAGDLAAHGGNAQQISEVCQDMSENYLTGALEHLPAAEITFDRYHIKAQLTKAVDEVRRAERGQLLRHTRYLWLRNPANLTDRQADRLQGLLRLPLKTGRAYRWMLKFDGLYEIEDPDQAAAYLRRWQRGAVRSRLEPIIDFAHLVREYWPGIVRWWHSHISNGLLEGLHSLVQAAKRRARGYRSTRNYLAMIHDPSHRRQARRRRHPHKLARSLHWGGYLRAPGSTLASTAAPACYPEAEEAPRSSV